jgi:hypothetical protein
MEHRLKDDIPVRIARRKFLAGRSRGFLPSPFAPANILSNSSAGETTK